MTGGRSPKNMKAQSAPKMAWVLEMALVGATPILWIERYRNNRDNAGEESPAARKASQ